MATLMDILKTTRNIHYRIYIANRDCLMFESYFKHHSSYVFNTFDTNVKYFGDNGFCDDVRSFGYKNPAFDEETAKMIECLGNYEVISLETDEFVPCNIIRKPGAQSSIDYLGIPIDCLNIFIAPAESLRDECPRCYRAIFDQESGVRCFDPVDAECAKCTGVRK